MIFNDVLKRLKRVLSKGEKMNLSKLKTVFPKAKEGIFDVLERELNFKDWSTESKYQFLAQCAHESAGFAVLKENLNYSADGLLKVFPKYFSKESALKYARKPDEIADIVYANRLGNGSVISHDGSKYKGRGLIQITGKTNYAKFGHENDPEYLETLKGAVESAIWFWETNKLYEISDFKTLTKKINGGLNGYEDRLANLQRIKKILVI